jgi:hypothetical protein
MKEGTERAREHRDHGYRVGLEEDVEHARGVEMGFGNWDDTVRSCVLVQKIASPRFVTFVPLAWRSKTKMRTLATASTRTVVATTNVSRERRCSCVGVAARTTLWIS